MCTIEKLSILGIRSFSPERPQVIEFGRPLTVILGPNGAGKTTIIECLKQICCGDLPPNVGKAGHGFVHDPKMLGESEIKAQIKLKFTSISKVPAVSTRTFQLTQKKNTMQFKQLEQTMVTQHPETKKREAMTYKCHELDALTTKMMGVDKAVLENVLLVHQEECNWPLSDGATLKKKFDDIFAASKYTKALEQLKKIAKEKTQQAKEFRLMMINLSNLLEVVQTIKGQIDDDQDKKAKLQQEIDEYKKDITETVEAANQISIKLGEGKRVQDQMMRKVNELDVQKRMTKSLYDRLPTGDLTEPNDELRNQLKQLEQIDSEDQTKIAEIERELQRQQTTYDALGKEIRIFNEKEANFKSAQENHSSNFSGIKEFLTKNSKIFNNFKPNLDSYKSDGQLQNETLRFVEFLNESNKALAGHERKLRSEEREKTDLLKGEKMKFDKQILDQSSTLEDINLKIPQCEKKLEAMESQLQGIQVSNYKIREARDQLQDENVTIETLKRKFDVQNFDKQLQAIDEKKSLLNQKRNEISETVQEFRQQENESRKIATYREIMHKRQDEVQELYDKERKNIQHAVESQLRGLENFDDYELQKRELNKITQKLKIKQSEFERQTSEKNRLSANLSKTLGIKDQNERQLKIVEQQIKQMRSEMEQMLLMEFSKIDISDNFDLSEKISELQKSKDQGVKMNAMSEVTIFLLDTYIKNGQTNKCCPICDQKLKGQAEIDKFVEKQNRDKKQLPENQAKLKQQIQGFDAKLAKLKQVQPTYLKIKDLSNNQPQIQSQLAQIQKQVEEQEQQLQECEETLALMTHEYENLTYLNTQFKPQIERLLEGIYQSQKELQGNRQTFGNSLSLLSIEEQESEKQRIEDQIEQLNQDKDNMYREKSRQQQTLNSYKDRQREAERRLDKLEKDLKTKEDVRIQMDAVELDISNMKKQKQHMEVQRPQLEREVRNKMESISQIEKQYASHFRTMEQETSNLNQMKYRLQSKLDAFTASLAKVQQLQKENIGEAKQQAEHQQHQVEHQKDKLKNQKVEIEKIKDSKTRKLSLIKDCLDWRSSVQKEQSYQENIELLKQQEIKIIGESNRLEQEYRELKVQIEEKKETKNKREGEIYNIDSNLMKLRNDLKDKKYKDIFPRYNKQSLELQTTELAAKDVELYHKALEKCLLVYHTQRMNNINGIIKELWQKTYRGSDIDYIHIVADADTQKSYNYRVVMHQNDVDLDMRGRCSAGQKVLACIVIRLALADLFCDNCGILALDEPTTNLDAANSKSLAEALQYILESRSRQRNFQLVVITHDESFANQLGVRSYADKIHKIYKDDNGHSVISTENF